MSLVILLGMTAPQAFAGNKDRSGQAGASQLLINPWAVSSGWGNAGMSKVHSLDAMFGNVAGITSCNSLDIDFSYTDWLHGTGVSAVQVIRLAALQRHHLPHVGEVMLKT